MRAILVDVIPSYLDKKSAERRVLELEQLIQTYGGIVIFKVIQRRAVPDYRTFVGSGKLEEILKVAQENDVKLIVMNNQLKPHQLFAIERRVERRGIAVWDRIDLILKIFQQHAKTTEAKLEIRLAGIRHMGPRIYRMGLELSQQAGGIGTRGAGETNIEIMKRHLAEEEKQIRKQLDRCKNVRALQRGHRKKMGYKTVAIVGYTNAGKSSLLNTLTKKGAHVADVLFATLDTRVGKLWLPSAQTSVLVSDTIGFIQDLPPQLIKAFHSTLEETVEADVLLHVVDINDPFIHQKIEEVEEILEKLGTESVPKIYVFNKIDQKKRIPKASLKKRYKQFCPVFVSAQTKEGLEDLKQAIADKVA